MSAIDAEAERIYDALGRGEPADVKTIKAALLCAEKRGREEERERIAKLVECDCCDACGESPGYPKCANEIADEIRRGT